MRVPCPSLARLALALAALAWAAVNSASDFFWAASASLAHCSCSAFLAAGVGPVGNGFSTSGALGASAFVLLWISTISVSPSPGLDEPRPFNATPTLGDPFDVIKLKRHAADGPAVKALRNAYGSMTDWHHLQGTTHRRIKRHAECHHESNQLRPRIVALQSRSINRNPMNDLLHALHHLLLLTA